MTVLDVSNHDYSTFDPACFKAAGVERLIVGCWQEPITRDIVVESRIAGIVVEDLYAYLYYGLGHERREVTNALAVAAAEGGIKRIWLDCEASPPNEVAGLTPSDRIARTDLAVGLIQANGIEVGIYTYGPYWRSQMGNTTKYSAAGHKLWHAAYGAGGNPIPPITEVNYGGWAKLAAHQYTSTVECCGRRRDHNYWYLDEEDWMTTKEGEDFLLAVFSGAEEAGLPREERLANARFRMQQGADGLANSVNDRIVSHIAAHPGGGASISAGAEVTVEIKEIKP